MTRSTTKACDIDSNAADNRFSLFAEKMRRKKLPEPLIELFHSYYDEICHKKTGMITEDEIMPIVQDDLPDISTLSDYENTGRKHVDQSVLIKLNGGLGTSMGMTFAKSLIPVRGGKSFLDIIVRQATDLMSSSVKMPLALMNSFSTHDDTLRTLNRMTGLTAKPQCFTQHMFPKIHRDTLEPATHSSDPSMEWNPPGHGDLYAALHLSGVLDALLSQGRRYAFVSNSDNLGATLDMRLLGYVVEKQIPFLMEVAPRTPSDKKGGHLAKRKDGGLILRELAQCPDDALDQFQDITRYGLFNTNNIWVDLQALQNHIEEHGLLRLPMILNPKTLDPRDDDSAPVYQVESAMGAAIAMFDGAAAIVTSRDRFIPVKKCSDLLVVMSDCFIIEDMKHVRPNPQRTLPPIEVNLDSRYYKTYDQLFDHFPYGAPSLINCKRLNVTGNVMFDAEITIIGDVTINNTKDSQVLIPRGTVLDKDITIK